MTYFADRLNLVKPKYMGYYTDLSKITLDEYKTKLELAYLPPSRMILKENLDERFAYFTNLGIKNVSELLSLLKQKGQITELQKLKLFNDNYPALLLRELKSMLPKPNRIIEFSGISKEIATKLEKIGLKTTTKLYDKVLNSTLRKKLAAETGITETDILELTKLTDLSRIKWVGTTFARMLYDLGIDTVEKATRADPIDLHLRINQLNQDQGIYRGQIGLNDIKIFIQEAKNVPLEIVY